MRRKCGLGNEIPNGIRATVLRYTDQLSLGIILLITPFPMQGQSPQVAAAFTQAAQAMREGKLEEAGEGFAAVIKEEPQFAGASFNLGLVRQQQGRYEEAIQSFQRVLKLQPHLRGANLFLGITEFRLNHLDSAAAAVQKETLLYPKDANAWMWLGVVRLAQERAEDAAEALDRADKLKPGDPDILYHRGRAHLLVSKDSYAEMYKADPHSWRVHRVLAQANAEADRHVEAIAEYEEAIKLAPVQPGLHEELGSELRDANKIPEAEAAFQRELEIDPENVLARYKLGAIAVEQGDGAKGKQLMEEAQREKPGLIHMDYNLGRAEMLLGNDAAAADHFERAVKTDPTPEVVQQAWYQLGTIYRREHRMDEARSAMATFQKLKDEEADRSQQRMRKLVSPDSGPPAAPTDAQIPQ
jgi:tetratricopeptide (TPR) repeat protein